MQTNSINLKTNKEFWQKVYKNIKCFFSVDGTWDQKRIFSVIRYWLGIKAIRGPLKESLIEQLNELAIELAKKKKRREESFYFSDLRMQRKTLEDRYYHKYRMIKGNLYKKREVIERAKKSFINEQIEPLYKQNYRVSVSSWAGGKNDIEINLSHQPKIDVRVYREWSKNGKWSGNSLKVTINIDPDWLDTVKNEGLASCHGLITTHATKLSDTEYKACWLERSRGFDVKVIHGFILRDGDRYFHGKTLASCYRSKKLADSSSKRQIDASEQKKKNIAYFDSLSLADIIDKFADLPLTKRLSKLAGNCESGTDNWLHKHNFSDRDIITVSEAYNADPQNDLVVAVIKTAVRRKLKA